MANRWATISAGNAEISRWHRRHSSPGEISSQIMQIEAASSPSRRGSEEAARGIFSEVMSSLL
jgi:hypothetical protein